MVRPVGAGRCQATYPFRSRQSNCGAGCRPRTCGRPRFYLVAPRATTGVLDTCGGSRVGLTRARRAVYRPDAVVAVRPPRPVLVVPQAAALPWRAARPCGSSTRARPAARAARGSVGVAGSVGTWRRPGRSARSRPRWDTPLLPRLRGIPRPARRLRSRTVHACHMVDGWRAAAVDTRRSHLRAHTGARRSHVGTADAMPAHAWRGARKHTNATRRGIGMTYVHLNYIGIRVGPGVSGRRAGEGGGPGAAATPTKPARRSRRAGRPVSTARTRARYSRSGVGSSAPGTGKRRSATARARAWPLRRS